MNLSILPVSLENLALDSLGLKEIPSNLQRLQSLNDVCVRIWRMRREGAFDSRLARGCFLWVRSRSFTGNPFTEVDISRLPSQLKSLYVRHSGGVRLIRAWTLIG